MQSQDGSVVGQACQPRLPIHVADSSTVLFFHVYQVDWNSLYSLVLLGILLLYADLRSVTHSLV